MDNANAGRSRRPVWELSLMADYKWNPQSVIELKALWQDGMSGSQIGRILGCTANAVIGKIHRLGFVGRDISDRPGSPRPKERKEKSLPKPPRPSLSSANSLPTRACRSKS